MVYFFLLHCLTDDIQIDHVAICFKLHSKLYFFEATGDSGVSMTSWDEFVMKNWKRFYTK